MFATLFLGLPWSIIFDKSAKYNLDSSLVAAIILQESRGKHCASRHEDTWKYVYNAKEFARESGVSVRTEEVGQKTSWGVMQIMGTVARELGFKGQFPELCDPALGIEYGCKQLKRIYSKQRELSDIIASYNAGGAYKKNSGQYINQEYVDSVTEYYDKIVESMEYINKI